MCWYCWWVMVDALRAWDRWSTRMLQGLLQGGFSQVPASHHPLWAALKQMGLCKKVAILRSAKLCQTAVEQKRAVTSYTPLGVWMFLL